MFALIGMSLGYRIAVMSFNKLAGQINLPLILSSLMVSSIMADMALALGADPASSTHWLGGGLLGGCLLCLGLAIWLIGRRRARTLVAPRSVQ